MERSKTSLAAGSVPSYHTCKHCQKLVAAFHDPVIDEFKAQAYHILFEASYDDIVGGAAEECKLYQYLEAKSPPYEVDFYQNTILAATVEDDWSEIKFMWWNWKTKSEKRQIGRSLGFSLSACPENITRRLKASGSINHTPGSGLSFDLYRQWLRKCQENHRACVQLEHSYMPKRLIKIVPKGATWHLYLQETCGLPKEAYVALSYCWGGPQPIQTTNENLHQLKNRISLPDLPLTLQDAVATTNELGIGFLWIDALCIIQDDDEDKGQEISQMPRIYENATVVIIASRAKNVRDGYLKPRKTPNHLKPFCGISFKDLESSDYGIITLYEPRRLGPSPEGMSEPLDDRAWALQERLLARRALDFGNLRTSWFCAQSKDQSLDGMYSDGWKGANNDGRNAAELRQDLFALKSNTEKPGIDIFAARESGINVWQDLLLIYTSRKLTVTEDRSLAISGIAEVFASAFCDDYLGGLWKFTFPLGILWRVLNPPRRRPASFQGPSWSWTSVNGPISLQTWSPGEFVYHESNLKLIDWNIKLAHEEAPFGGVVFGHLQVKGLLKPASLVHDTKLETQRLKAVNGPLYVSFDEDCLEEEFIDQDGGSTPVYLLSVISLPLSHRHGEYRNYGANGLVLRALENHQFSRLGLFLFSRHFCERKKHESEEEWNQRWESQKTWFDGCEPQVITLI